MRLFAYTLALALFGCTSSLSAEISRLAEASGESKLELSKVGGAQWERICFLGPYSNNESATKTLGFPWDVESRTSILTSDGINVLVFVIGEKVVAYTEHPRTEDFWKLSGQCFPRSDAVFVKSAGSYVRVSAQLGAPADVFASAALRQIRG